MHIITTIERGGAENQLFTLVKTQRDHDHKVEVAYIKGNPELKSLFEEIDVIVHDLSSYPNFLLQIFALRNILNKSTPNVAHAHLPRAELILKLSTLHMKIRRVYTRHNQEAFFPNRPKCISNFLSRFVSMNAYAGIAISHAVRRYCVARGEIHDESRFSTIHYGFEPGSVYSSENKKEPRLGNIACTVSRLVAQKDLPTMIAGFKQYIASDERAGELQIIGEGPLKEELILLVAELGLSNRIKFLGRSSDVESLMLESSIFILSSRYEGFGLVLLEALNCKLPIIATRSEAVVEVLGTDYPYLFEIGNSKELAAKLTEIADVDLEWYERYSGERLILFSTDKLIEQTLRIYQNGFL